MKITNCLVIKTIKNTIFYQKNYTSSLRSNFLLYFDDDDGLMIVNCHTRNPHTKVFVLDLWYLMKLSIVITQY